MEVAESGTTMKKNEVNCIFARSLGKESRKNSRKGRFCNVKRGETGIKSGKGQKRVGSSDSGSSDTYKH